MAAHSNILAGKIPWTEEPGDWSTQCCKESDTPERLSVQSRCARWGILGFQQMLEKWTKDRLIQQMKWQKKAVILKSLQADRGRRGIVRLSRWLRVDSDWKEVLGGMRSSMWRAKRCVLTRIRWVLWACLVLYTAGHNLCLIWPSQQALGDIRAATVVSVLQIRSLQLMKFKGPARVPCESAVEQVWTSTMWLHIQCLSGTCHSLHWQPHLVISLT